MNGVVVVGAGPAGAAIAYLLACNGIPVRLLEQESQFDRVFRGEGLMPSGIAALEEMGLSPCLERIPSRVLDAWDFYIDRQRRMRVVEPQNYLGSQSTRIIHQGALLKTIIHQARHHDSFEFYPGWRVRQLRRDHGRVSGVSASDGHQTRDFAADLIIAADGRYSQLRKQAALPLVKSSTQFDVLWFKLPAPPEILCETVFTVCLQRQRQFAFYPSWDERLQIGWIVEKGRANGIRDRDWIEAFIPALPASLAEYFRQHRTDLEGPICLDVMVGLAPQWSQPGLLLMGDAAHPMAPNRAQGMNMAFRDAIAIANHLVPLLRHSWTHHQLDTALQEIQTARQPEIEAIQHLQLEEWQKINLITTSSLTYQSFKGLATVFGRFGLTQQTWLWQQRGLRHGITPLTLEV